MYRYTVQTSEHLTLHDCRAQHATFRDGVLTFCFADGVWLGAEHPDNETKDTVRTGGAQASFVLSAEDDPVVYIFTRRGKKTVRTAWTLEQLTDVLERDGWELEFLYRFRNGENWIVDAVLWFEKRPYWNECELRLSIRQETYSWNDLQPEKRW